jgi:glyoxylase-like metal-dependent hydrolase (beta-lactamase superfamily II)
MSSNRRGFLRTTLGACWTGASLLEQSIFRATQARAQASSTPQPALFEIEKVADGVYAAIAKPVALTNSNAAIFENTDDLLIVDTHSKPSAVIALVSQIRREITLKPVRYIVNSHFHWDHTQGNHGYKRIAPSADIVASEPTRQLLSKLSETRLKASLAEAQKSLENYQQQLAAAKTAEDKAYFGEAVRETNDYLAEMRAFTPELPNITFDSDLILHDRAHDLHLAFRGRGHTAGDVVVFCPQKKAVATGDLLHGFAPFLTDAYPYDWPRTLLHIAEFRFDHVMGGHGGVQHSKDRLYQKCAFIEELTDRVAGLLRNGQTVDQIKGEIRPDQLKSLANGGYGAFLLESLKRYRFLSPAQKAADVLAAAVEGCIDQMAVALQNSN